MKQKAKKQQSPGFWRRLGGRFAFIGNIISELKKVTWPPRRETIYLTAIVIVVSVVVGITLYGFDYGFSKWIEEGFLDRKMIAVYIGAGVIAGGVAAFFIQRAITRRR